MRGKLRYTLIFGGLESAIGWLYSCRIAYNKMGSITPEDYRRMLLRLEGSKLREVSPCEDAVEKELPLHYDIIKWCKEQFPQAPYVHSRTDKKSRVGKGVVDFVIGYAGQVFWIECKDEGGKESTDQLIFALLLEKQGLKRYICRSFSEFMEIVNKPI